MSIPIQHRDAGADGDEQEDERDGQTHASDLISRAAARGARCYAFCLMRQTPVSIQVGPPAIVSASIHAST